MTWRATLCALALAALANEARAGCQLAKVAELPVTMTGLRPLVHAQINGKDATFIVDSGAFYSTLSPAAVAKFGMIGAPAPMGFRISGFGGSSSVAVATAKDFDFAGTHFHHADFLVGEKSFGGTEDGLIGQNLLGDEDVEYDLANGVIRLFESKGCAGANLAYWAGDQAYSVVDTKRLAEGDATQTALASVNGMDVRVMFDTGSPLSLLDAPVAAKAGVPAGDASTVGSTSGVALNSFLKEWIAPVDSFKLGDEEIKRTHLRVAPMNLYDGVGMLIGADFFLSHRVYVSNSQHKLYFTYNGGPVFDLTSVREGSAAPPAAEAKVAGAYADAPSDADGFSRRAAAELTRGSVNEAIADLDQAVQRAPGEPRYRVQRGQAEARGGKTDAALADFAEALRLAPDDVDALLNRAGLHVAMNDKSAARADVALADKAMAGDADARLSLAALDDGIGDYEAGIGQIDRWIAAHPKSDQMAAALNHRCWLRALLGRELDQALADCNAALRLDPGDPQIIDSRGLVRLRRGDLDKALADYQAASALLPNSAWTRYGKGLVELKRGDKAAGEADLKAAASLGPGLADEARGVGLAP